MFTNNLNQAFFALRGLKVTTKFAPFLHLQSHSGSSLNYQFFDMVGQPVADESTEAPTFKLVSNVNTEVDVTDVAALSASAGTINISLKDKDLAPALFDSFLAFRGVGKQPH